jgi:hypothetical protein
MSLLQNEAKNHAHHEMAGIAGFILDQPEDRLEYTNVFPLACIR